MMRKSMLGLFTLILAVPFATAGEASAQGGTAPQSQSMGASRSGSAIDPDPGKGDRPAAVNKGQFDKGFTGQESGIGEKGTGQDRSTMERSAESRARHPRLILNVGMESPEKNKGPMTVRDILSNDAERLTYTVFCPHAIKSIWDPFS